MVFARGVFREILLAADNLYEKMGRNTKERDSLMGQMCTYRKRLPPFDIPFCSSKSPQIWWSSIEDCFAKNEDHICQLAIKLFAITPHAAGCERIWSRLGWYYGDRRTRLSLGKLENMQKLASYYLSNAKKELPHYSIGKTTAELQEIIRDAEIFEEDDKLDEEDLLEQEDSMDKQDNLEKEEILGIEGLINLDAKVIVEELGEIIEESRECVRIDNIHINVNDNNDSDHGNENWDPEDAANKYAEL